MGAAGDMVTAALLELLENQEDVIKRLNASGIPGVVYTAEKSVKCGVKGTHLKVTVDGIEEIVVDVNESNHDAPHPHVHSSHDHDHSYEHSHRGMHEISHIIGGLNISDKVKEDAIAIYNIIAEAESHVHGAPVDKIHFHEVGEMDAIADVTAAAFLMNKINPDKVIISPINTGKGQVKCAHGIIPVPAPATAYILQGMPAYSNYINGELCTPTGAAIIKYYADEFGSMPVMDIKKIGYGMGHKDFEAANCVRIFLGESLTESDKIIELNFNVDDMTGEEIGFASERFLELGAREVFTTPVVMKKSRPGQLVTLICSVDMRQDMVKAIFKYTTTIGIREAVHPRYVLDRSMKSIDTKLGSIRRKVSSGYGITRDKYEYDDLSRIARENNLSIADVKKIIENHKQD